MVQGGQGSLGKNSPAKSGWPFDQERDFLKKVIFHNRGSSMRFCGEIAPDSGFRLHVP